MAASKIPPALRRSLGALLLLMGAAGGVYVTKEEAVAEADRNAYVQAVAADASTSEAVKIAMVMGSYYESSGRHIGAPYVDMAGKGQPLTVCNGVTGAGVVAGRYYTAADCLQLERGHYIEAEAQAAKRLRYWNSYDPFVQATFIDFIYNKPLASFETSTMRALANGGDLPGACRQNPRWNKGTVRGVLTVLPGLQTRGDSNAEICEYWRMPA